MEDGRSRSSGSVRVVIVPGPGHGHPRSRRVGDRRDDRRLARSRRHAARAADDRGDRRGLHDEGASRVHRRPRQARHHRTSTTCRSTRGPPASFGYDCEEDRRITRCISFLRDGQDRQRLRAPDRRPDRPLRHGEQRGDRGHRPRHHAAAAEPGELLRRAPAADARRAEADLDHAARRCRASPSTATASSGRTGRCASAFDPYEGLVLHQITYDDNGRVRSILHRASISEMVVPYGDPSELHGWKNAFDAGEWGLGRMTQPLTLGCDCLGEIHYFDATIANEQGKPWVIRTRSACTKRTTGSSGSTSTCSAVDPRSAAAAGSWSASSRRSATTSTASTGTSTSTATSSSR